jgi:peptidoglycan/xylan/chitin deacetylase (PgdA/CDA1 family)
MMLTQSPRYDFVPIIEREPIAFPDGKRLAVLLYVNLEHVPFLASAPGHAIYPGTTHLVPDILNHGWRDYGHRVGVWRLMDAMDRTGFRATAHLHSDVCREYPQIIAAGRKRQWEWLGLGDHNQGLMIDRTPDEQRRFVRTTLDGIERATGQRPKGWISWCMTESVETPDILASEGIEYLSDYAHDELPVPMRVEGGTLLTLPYTVEINDVPTILGKGASGEAFGRIIKDQFDILYEEAARLPKIMSISLHPPVSGHPFRMKYIADALAYIAGHPGVWLATGSEINRWYRENYAQPM